jgi:fusion and transport protein UGO1
MRDEGGIAGLYFHPQLLIPTVLDTTLTSLAALALPSLLARSLGAARIAPDTHPIAWSLAELAGSCVGLLVTLPFETVRRRLQVQTRGRAQALRTCVETRPAPYNGVVDALWHILTEERSDLPIKRRSHKRRSSNAAKGKGKDAEVTDDEGEGEAHSWWRNTGLGQLYRGMGIRLSASALVFLLAAVSGGDETDLGWTEL